MIWSIILSLATLAEVFWFTKTSDLWTLVVLIGWVVLLRRESSRIKALLWLTAGLTGLSLILFRFALADNSVRAANWVFWLWLIALGWLIDQEWRRH